MHLILKTTVSEDIPRIARCYSVAFSKSLASAFGSEYVMKTLSWFLSTNRNFLFHLEDEHSGNVVGFCGGMINDGITPRGSASEMIQFAFLEGMWSLLKRPWLLFHSEMIPKYGLAFKNLQRRFIKTPVQNYPSGTVEPFCGLVVIGVSPEYQNRGVGTQLLQEFEAQSRFNGFLKMQLSVKFDNYQAIRSYEKNGWSKGEQKGRSLVMFKILTNMM